MPINLYTKQDLARFKTHSNGYSVDDFLSLNRPQSNRYTDVLADGIADPYITVQQYTVARPVYNARGKVVDYSYTHPEVLTFLHDTNNSQNTFDINAFRKESDEIKNQAVEFFRVYSTVNPEESEKLQKLYNDWQAHFINYVNGLNTVDGGFTMPNPRQFSKSFIDAICQESKAAMAQKIEGTAALLHDSLQLSYARNIHGTYANNNSLVPLKPSEYDNGKKL